jgi:succinoglycan biosynthesis protein ExoM
MKIAICMATFHRPEGLARLLEGLNALEPPTDSAEIELVVVDNDAEGSGRKICDRLRPAMRWPLSYHIEPRRGIAPARNKALACVDSTADWIVFIDDDEAPAPNWLVELFRTQREYDADVVTGPVFPRLEDGAPTWIKKGRFFDGPRYETGHRLDRSATNNVLFKAAIVRGMPKHFEERFALMGCDDTHFFRRIHLAGHKIVWAASAVVYEWVPKSRANARWLILRLFRAGNSSTAIEVDLFGGLRTIAPAMAKGLVWILIGMVLTPWGLVSGRANLIKALRYLAFGVGRLSWLAGVRYEEYRTTHGTRGGPARSEPRP